MIKQQQLYAHCPEKGITGDCWRTSLACLLEAPVEDVPHWLLPGTDFSVVLKQTNVLLRNTYKVQYIEFPLATQSIEDVQSWGKSYLADVYWLLIGKSSGPNTDHCEIWKGAEFQHSTNASRVIGPSIHNGYYWVGLLVKV